MSRALKPRSKPAAKAPEASKPTHVPALADEPPSDVRAPDPYARPLDPYAPIPR